MLKKMVLTYCQQTKKQAFTLCESLFFNAKELISREFVLDPLQHIFQSLRLQVPSAHMHVAYW